MTRLRDCRKWWRVHVARAERVWILLCVTFSGVVALVELVAHGRPW